MDTKHLEKLLPYIPILVPYFGCWAFGWLCGFIFKSWLGRQRPSQLELVGKVFFAVSLLLVYLVSTLWSMASPSYQTPYMLHFLIAIIVSTLFPKRWVSIGGLLKTLKETAENEEEGKKNE